MPQHAPARRLGPSSGRLAGVLIAGVLLMPVPAARAAEASSEPVPACDSLVALRQLAAGAHEDRARVIAQVSAQAGCRLVPRAEIGAVERRAMVGGAPYECLAVATGGCLWVLP